MFLPLALGLVVGAVLWRADERRRTPQVPGPTVVEHVCTYEPAPEPTRQELPWDGLERCLREAPFASATWQPPTVADVRRWVEVEHDPVWNENGTWWFPLSGEGDPQMPSGLYVGVPPDGTRPCPGSIVN